MKRSCFARAGLAAMLACGLLAAPAKASGGAMIFGLDSVGTPDTVTLPEATDQWFTQFNASYNHGTQIPSYWVNKVGGELDSLIEFCGTLNMSAYGQALGCVQQIADSTHGLVNFSAGTTNWTVPANVYYVHERVWGGGAGGGGSATGFDAAGGGGAGGYCDGWIAVTPGQVISVTVGAGGAGGAADSTASGNGGGNSYFGAVEASGGYAGTGAAASAIGAPGGGGSCYASGSYIGLPGGGGGYGQTQTFPLSTSGTVSIYQGGNGGAAPFGYGPALGTFTGGQNGAMGVGGSGGANGYAGGTGGGGAVWADW